MKRRVLSRIWNGRPAVGLSAGLCAGLVLGALGCTEPGISPTQEGERAAVEEPVQTQAQEKAMDAVAEAYVKLVLELGNHDKDYVDAYYGAPEWRETAQASTRDLAAILADAEARLADLDSARLPDEADEMLQLRRRYLERQLQSLAARARLLGGAEMSFDEESEALYDAVAPVLDAAHFEETLQQLDGLLAEQGLTEGDVLDRLDTFRRGFVIPTDKVDAVFRAAIDECRRRSAEHLELPEGESFTVEYVEDKSWSAYNWYQGGFQSLIQVNLDLPIYIDRAVDLACHEGYPGHHVYNALLEKNLVRDRGWVELSVYPLFSPQSLIAEGSANYGIEMAFPGDERTAYEAEALYPIAGLDASKAEVYTEVMSLVGRLAYAGNEAARGYLDGTMTGEQAVDWLVSYAAMSRPRAEQRLRFIEQYRSYVINYNLGQDLVRRHVDLAAGDEPERRWEVFGELLSSPRLPSGLRR